MAPEDDAEWSEAVESLELSIEQAPDDYRLRWYQLTLLRLAGNSEDLRRRREACASRWPMPEQCWREWIEDEEGAEEDSMSDEAYDKIDAMYRRAVDDFASPEICMRWFEFLDRWFLRGLTRQAEQGGQMHPSLQRVRDCYELVLQKLGARLAESAGLWDRYRRFEVAILTVIEDEDEKKLQVRRIRELFRREFAHPHLQIEDVYRQAYLPWEAEVSSILPVQEDEKQQIQRLYSDALEFVNLRKVYQYDEPENVDPSAYPPTPWQSYLSFELSQDAPASTLSCLYERAVATHFACSQLWAEYALFLLSSSPAYPCDTSDIQSLLRRANQLCPDCVDLLPCRLFYLEFTRSDELFAEFQSALSSVPEEAKFSICQQYLDACSRSSTNGRESLDRALSFFHQHVPQHHLDLLLDAVDHASLRRRDTDHADSLCSLATHLYPTSSRSWLKRIRFELSRHHVQKARSLFHEASHLQLDHPELLLHERTSLERFHGHLHQYLQSIYLYSKHHLLTPPPPPSPSQKNSHKRSPQPHYTPPHKRTKPTSPPPPSTDYFQLLPHSPEPSPSRRPPNSNPLWLKVSNLPSDPSFSPSSLFSLLSPSSPILRIRYSPSDPSHAFVLLPSKRHVSLALSKHPPVYTLSWNMGSSDVSLSPLSYTVFVHNLGPNSSKQSIHSVLKSANLALPFDIRIPRLHDTGKHRRIAYLDYDDSTPLDTVVSQLNGLVINGRRIHAAPSAPPPKPSPPPSTAPPTPPQAPPRPLLPRPLATRRPKLNMSASPT
ncbi:squamous cell carcinoma antigen recognized by T-cells 3-like [Schistocerca gregaria]|uniref:squamous cell carcinoma antigen recognized by T-cells 3-like n=1 Tax=Schistocerca gregaria TaxID=7010 RepID=UPI00211EF6F5|nr:squamous cell carcinoma antigen recognized by T-cells 3-like [Schistocerca gregaria]